MRRILMISLGAILAANAAAQQRMPRNVMKPALPFHLHPVVHKQDTIVLKFVDDIPVRMVEGQFTAQTPAPADFVPYTNLLTGTEISRLFTRSVSDLDQERGQASARMPAHLPLPADLNNYYRVITSSAAHTEELINELNTMPLVETAYAEMSRDAMVMANGSDISPTTPLFEVQEDYKDPAPSGHGYNEFANIVGARAPDLSVGHLEGSWHYGHEDDCQIETGNVVGTIPDSSWNGWRDHGNACAGLLTAERNAYGTRGMANGAQLILSSLATGAADMISQSAAAASAGDVLESSWVWVTPTGVHAPVDWTQAEFDAVNTAAAMGVLYCYSAGNTDVDLADASHFGTRWQPGQPDSGGVIVGARNSTDEDKIWFSNYGERVDCSAWGEAIATLGYGDLFFPSGDEQQAYTDTFGGTSGAAPIVAGVAAALSNIVREQNNKQLTAFEIRELLRNHGTPQGSGGDVGLKADLEVLLAQENLPDGLNLQGDAVLGQNFTLEVSGEPSSPFIVFGSADRDHAATNLNRDLLVNTVTGFLVTGFAYDGTGSADIVAEFPNDSAFVDTSLFFQVLDAVGGQLHLTNSVELWVRE